MGPIDGALALGVVAPRAVRRARRHLLPAAPLLGRASRRLVAPAAAWRPGGAFAWRAPAVPAPGRTHEIVLRERTNREMVRTTTVVSRTPAPAPSPAVASVPRAIVAPAAPTPAGAATSSPSPSSAATRRVAGEKAHEAPAGQLVEPPSTKALPPAAEDPRGFTVAPALIWFARWETLRLARTVQDRRSATLLAPDGVRRRLVRAAPAASDDVPTAAVAGAPVPQAAMGAVESPVGGTRVRALRWAPTLVPLLRFASGVPRGGDGAKGGQIPAAVSLATLAASGSGAGAASKVLSIVSDALREGIASGVRAEVARVKPQIDAARSAPAERRTEPPPAPPRVDDRLAGALLDRIRGLLREERFRHGLVR